MARKRSLSSSLFRAARIADDIEAAGSGNPKRAARRTKERGPGAVARPGRRLAEVVEMNEEFDDLMTDDAKLISALARLGGPHAPWFVAEASGVDLDYAERALARMADDLDGGYPVLRRVDLGPDVYEVLEA